MRFFAAAFIFCGVASWGQAPQVPHKIHFAGMTLTIRADAREAIQADVDLLTKSPKYFNIKVERAKTYFPIIERIFKEEKVPDELKFLVLQESALIANAVSTSNAVGFWQFKAETGKEMGLKINRRVDERMNISESTRAAARYFKQSNNYFNNWLLVVQSYQMGIGGTMRAVGEEHMGVRHMTVTSDTYWYVRKYLAHLIAFQGATDGKSQVEVTAVMASGITLDEISKKSGVELEKLKDYNKWAIDGEVPADKDYAVVIPKGDMKDFNNLYLTSSSKTTTASTATTTQKEIMKNGLRAITALPGETISKMATRTQVEVDDFVRWNDASIDQTVKPGQVFYLQRKLKNTTATEHLAKAGEDLWIISQTYGIRLKTLKKLNSKLADGTIPVGKIVVLSYAKTRTEPLEEFVELDPTSPFEFGISGKGELDYRIDVSEPETNETKPGTLTKTLVKQKENPATTTPAEKQGKHHVVKPSDTIYGIARQYGLTVKELMDLNQKKDFNLKPGEKLLIQK